MTYQHYSPEFKAKIVLQVIQGEKELGEVAKEHNINPNLIRKWRTVFLEKASMVFEDPEKGAAKAKRKEESLEKKQRQMLSTIGQLKLERDFLQDAFRRTGRPVPRFNPEDEQCELLGVIRSKVYYTPKSRDEEAIERKERIMSLIDYWHTENPTWGARKIRVLLSSAVSSVRDGSNSDR